MVSDNCSHETSWRGLRSWGSSAPPVLRHREESTQESSHLWVGMSRDCFVPSSQLSAQPKVLKAGCWAPHSRVLEWVSPSPVILEGLWLISSRPQPGSANSTWGKATIWPSSGQWITSAVLGTPKTTTNGTAGQKTYNVRVQTLDLAHARHVLYHMNCPLWCLEVRSDLRLLFMCSLTWQLCRDITYNKKQAQPLLCTCGIQTMEIFKAAIDKYLCLSELSSHSLNFLIKLCHGENTF